MGFFDQIEPTAEQHGDMAVVREAAESFVEAVQVAVPNGADKTYILRKFRECVMWANVAIVKDSDGTPRQRPDRPPK